MSKLHYCDDGVSVTDKVLDYKASSSNDAFISIHNYYNNFKDRWYLDLVEFLDRSTFESEFDFKLCRAIESFDEDQARQLCEKYKWSFLGAFNRWFYAILRNWKSNVKTSAFRQKKRPSVQCPVCGRFVPKIDEFHLAHYKTKSDLPRAFTYKNTIYSVMSFPDAMAVSWGKYSKRKLAEINAGDVKAYKKTKVEWLWYTRRGTRGVMCPFTKKIVPEINADYIRTLPNKHSRHAKPYTWQEFVEEYPHPILIQAEIYSLDYNGADDDVFLRDNIIVKQSVAPIGHEDIEENRVPTEYEDVFLLIEQCVKDETNQKILKLAAIGYSDEDISSVLEIERKEVRRRKKDIRVSGGDLKQKLTDSV